MLRTPEIRTQLEILFAFSADLEEQNLARLQARTFGQDFRVLELHREFLSHRDKQRFVEKVFGYLGPHFFIFSRRAIFIDETRN